MKKKPAIRRETLEAIEDDIELRFDQLFDRLTTFFRKHASSLKEEGLRAVCVDHAHVDAAVIQDAYDAKLAAMFEADNIAYYLAEWKKSLVRD